MIFTRYTFILTIAKDLSDFSNYNHYNAYKYKKLPQNNYLWFIYNADKSCYILQIGSSASDLAYIYSSTTVLKLRNNMYPVNIPGFEITSVLCSNRTSLVLRGLALPERKPVVLKLLSEEYPSPETLARFRSEFELLTSLKLPEVVRGYGWQHYRHSYFIVMEDYGGESLDRLLDRDNYDVFGPENPLDLALILEIGSKVAATLGQIHRLYLIHNDLNPSNILLNRATSQVKLIDFGSALLLSREVPDFRNPALLEGTLAYMSPEQTGRMNRTIDYRTDFYSLGATLFELLTGRPPFTAQDDLEMIHSHIARQPVSPSSLNPAIPEAVSNIVLKLLAKDPGQRYQTAAGLVADLDACLEGWRAGNIPSFALGQHDIDDKFQLPQKLYGREAETQRLLAAFERACGGQSEVVLVTGQPGIGKTSLVREIYRPLTLQNGYFISGKFDQFERHIPYAALVETFRSLVRQLLGETEARLREWRERLLAALDQNGQVLVEAIPEIEKIIGPQPPVPTLSPVEAQNRFSLVFKNFIEVFSRAENPLVIFLDDLQWTDAASLKMLEMLMTSPDNRYIFLIGAYRSEEVRPVYPFAATIERIKETGVPVTELHLAPLGLPQVTALVADTLSCPIERAAPLAGLLLEKTGGNPFFLHEFFKTLHTERLIEFDYVTRRWQWSLAHIRTQAVTDNVVGLLSEKVHKFSPPTQEILQFAAIIGNKFQLTTLALVSEKSPGEVAALLLEPVREGLVLPSSENYRFLAAHALAENSTPTQAEQADRLNKLPANLISDLEIEFTFAHDRVQEVVYTLVPSERRWAMHGQVGQLLLQNALREEQDRQVFDIVYHLNLALQDCDSSVSSLEVARLNLQAGRKARLSAAFDNASSYFEQGLGLLAREADPWQTAYDLSLALYTEATEAAFLTGRVADMERLAQVVIDHARSLPDVSPVYEIKILNETSQNRLLEAIDACRQVLKKFGVILPYKPGKLRVLAAYLKTRLNLAKRGKLDINTMPLLTDPHQKSVQRLLLSITTPVYLADPDLAPLVSFTSINVTLKHGLSREAAQSFAAYGAILSGFLGEHELGYRYGKLALQILDRFDARELRPMVAVIYNFLIPSWKEHTRLTLDPLLEGYQGGLEVGNFEAAAQNANLYCFHSLMVGKNLTVVEQDLAKYNGVMQRLNQNKHLLPLKRHWQLALNLLGQGTQDKLHLVGQAYDEAVILPRLLAANDVTELGSIYFNKAMLGYLYGEYEYAFENIEQSGKYLAGLMGQIMIPLYYFYRSLILLAILAKKPGTEALAGRYASKREVWLKEIAKNQAKMKKWSKAAPMNFLHKYYLVEAELAGLQGKSGAAREFYDRAIELAQENEYVQEEAYANELAAQYYAGREQAKTAMLYLQEAYYAYQRWGAVVKLEQLNTRHPELEASLRGQQTAAARSTRTTSTKRSSKELDYASLIKAAQVISGEILPGHLAARLLAIFLENAGAQRGVLLLERNQQLYLEGEARVGKPGDAPEFEARAEELSSPLAAAHLPISLINYVVHTQESLVLESAARQGSFTNDPYVTRHQTQSILCLPIMARGKLLGVLYLENNLLAAGFPAERVESLSILTAQAAISIENSRLYENLDNLVKQRTAELQAEMTDRQRAEQIALEGEQRWRGLLRDAALPIVIIRQADGTVVYANQKAVDLFETTVEASVGKARTPTYYANPAERDLMVRTIEEKGGVYDFETQYKTVKGKVFWALTSATMVEFDNEPAIFVSFNDMTARRRMMEELRDKSIELERLATTDELTQLYNRRYANEKLRAEFAFSERYGQQLAIGSLDIDLFKQVNDRYGHATGDLVIKTLAAELRAELRETDVAARMGGEEFLIILPHTGLDEAWTVLERLRLKLTDLHIPGVEEKITFSGGVVMRHPGERPLEVLKRVDRLLYQAKEAGRNRVLKEEGFYYEAGLRSN